MTLQVASELLTAKLPTVILPNPNGTYSLAGSIPLELTKQIRNPYGRDRVSQVWQTEQEVIDALLGVGITRFQLSDCSWYKGGAA